MPASRPVLSWRSRSKTALAQDAGAPGRPQGSLMRSTRNRIASHLSNGGDPSAIRWCSRTWLTSTASPEKIDAPPSLSGLRNLSQSLVRDRFSVALSSDMRDAGNEANLGVITPARRAGLAKGEQGLRNSIFGVGLATHFDRSTKMRICIFMRSSASKSGLKARRIDRSKRNIAPSGTS